MIDKIRAKIKGHRALFSARQILVNNITNPKKVAINILLALLIAVGGSIFLFGSPAFASSPSALDSNCILSIETGNVQIQPTGTDTWKDGFDGMALEAGYRVKTGPQSVALLTFFEGSTIELNANTDLEIEQVEYQEKDTAIVLKQWSGKTWSRVVKLTTPLSVYEINTPSASATVRGTSFTTSVDDAGSTLVQVAEGLVGVGAQSNLTFVAAGYEVNVENGQGPGPLSPISSSIGKGNDKNNSEDNGKGNNKGNEEDNGNE